MYSRRDAETHCLKQSRRRSKMSGTAIVTGATHGLGKAIAIALPAQG